MRLARAHPEYGTDWFQKPLSGVLLSVTLVALVSLLRLALSRVLEDNAPYLLFLASVAAVAYLCGWKDALLTTVLSLIAGSYLFAMPQQSLVVADAEDMLSGALFLLASAVIMAAFSAEARARQGLVERDAQLRGEMARRAQLEAELEQARRLESVGRLAGGIAHDFNNLLSVMIGNCELLRHKLANDEQLESIALAARRGADLVRQLLGFAGRQMMTLHSLSLNQAVRDTERLAARLIPENIRFELTLEPELWSFDGDVTQVQQVLLNLITNARDSMPDGGTIRIETANVHLAAGEAPADVRPGDYVQVRVVDTGVGMSQELLQHAFEPFFTTKKVGNGSGLGLAVSYGIVRQLGGHISVSSRPDQGSSFQVLWPRSEPARSEEKPAPKSPSDALRQLRVLVVEDDPLVRAVIERQLRRLGHEVTTAENADDALRLSDESQRRLDVLLTDVVMPGINGRELADRLLALHPALRVLFVSGYSESFVQEKGLLGQGMMLVKKPFTSEQLQSALHSLTSPAGA